MKIYTHTTDVRDALARLSGISTKTKNAYWGQTRLVADDDGLRLHHYNEVYGTTQCPTARIAEQGACFVDPKQLRSFVAGRPGAPFTMTLEHHRLLLERGDGLTATLIVTPVEGAPALPTVENVQLTVWLEKSQRDNVAAYVVPSGDYGSYLYSYQCLWFTPTQSGACRAIATDGYRFGQINCGAAWCRTAPDPLAVPLNLWHAAKPALNASAFALSVGTCTAGGHRGVYLDPNDEYQTRFAREWAAPDRLPSWLDSAAIPRPSKQFLSVTVATEALRAALKQIKGTGNNTFSRVDLDATGDTLKIKRRFDPDDPAGVETFVPIIIRTKLDTPKQVLFPTGVTFGFLLDSATVPAQQIRFQFSHPAYAIEVGYNPESDVLQLMMPWGDRS